MKVTYIVEPQDDMTIWEALRDTLARLRKGGYRLSCVYRDMPLRFVVVAEGL